MSVRIHELAKRIGMDNKELLALLKGRGFDVKTVSSTVDPISAEALESHQLTVLLSLNFLTDQALRVGSMLPLKLLPERIKVF